MSKVFLLGVSLLTSSAFAVEVKVDFATPAGLVKPMHGVGQPPLLGHDNASLFHYLKEAGVPYSRLHDVGGAFARGVLVDIPNLFRNFDADENDPANYDFAFTDILIDNLVKNGVEPYFRLGVTIENSRKVKAYRIDPPKDFAKWARICEHVIRHYTEGWANGFRHKITYWEIWNEPENEEKPETNQMWTGSWADYCRLYEVAAKHLKGRFPHLKIGGYGSCGFYAVAPGKWVCPRTVYMVDCYTNFLSHVRRTETPLDFFSFHAYSSPSDAVLQTKWAIDTLRAYGFAETETSLNEWHPGGGIAKLGTAEQAAAICAEMIGLQQTELDTAMLYDARCGVGTYSPLFNPLTLKPHKAYYALKAFNELYALKNAVKTVSDDGDVWALAACYGRRAKVVIANTSDSAKDLSCDFQGRTVTDMILTDAAHTYEKVAPATRLPPQSFAVLTLSDFDPASSKISGPRIAYSPNVVATPQLRGVMLPMRDCVEDDFRTLREWGATLVRYQMVGAKDDWKGLDPDRDVDEVVRRYGKWLDGRLDHLERVVLPLAKKYGMRVCVDLHEVPGYRYSKCVGVVPRGRGNEFRLFFSDAYRRAFYDSWRKIATRFKGDPAIYGFDLVNEPAQYGQVPVGYWELQAEAARIVRSVDPTTPIVVEANYMDNPDAFQTLRPLDLDNVIYQVHMYMPFLFTHQAVAIDRDWTTRAAYPDPARGWDKIHLRECLRFVRAFERRHGARIYVGEFSAPAWAKGADAYLRDCIEIFNEYGWDWTYHAFREYEGWSVEHEWPDRRRTKPVPSADNPRMRALKEGLKAETNPEICHYDHLEDSILALIHFGPNSFTGLEWGYGDTPASVFNPTKFDADQWADAMVAAGIRRVILVAKHHDGFCLWPSAGNDDYSVANSPWRGGKGDVVREVSDACRRKGLKFGVYLSPWDRHQANFAKDGYPEYYRRQVDELLTNYGPISELWLDGAFGVDGWYGGAKERRKFPRPAWEYYDMPSVIESLHRRHPTAVAFNGGGLHSANYVGNERGVASERLWGKSRDGRFASVECDVALRPGWFWKAQEQPKTLAHLVEIYFCSVGRGAVLDLGIAPNQEGLVCDADVKRLREFGDWVRRFNSVDFVSGGKSVRSDRAIEVVLAHPAKANCLDVREDISKGQKIAGWKGEVRVAGVWRTVVDGSTVGFRRLARFDEAVVEAVRVTIVDGAEDSRWAGLSLRHAPDVPRERPVDLGMVTTFDHYRDCLDLSGPANEWTWHFKSPVKISAVLFRPFFNDQVFVDKYEVLASDDGKTWTVLKAGEFGNVKANPVAQWVSFDRAMNLRHLKVKALHAVDDVQPVWNRKNLSVVGFGVREIRK